MEKFPNLNLNQGEIERSENEKLEELREAEIEGVEKDEIIEVELHDKLKHRKGELGVENNKEEMEAELRESEMGQVEKDDYVKEAKNYTEVFKKISAEEIISKESGTDIPGLDEKFKEEFEEIKKMPEKDKKRLFEKLVDFGYGTTQLKCWALGSAMKQFSKLSKRNKVVSSFFNNYAGIYEKQGAKARHMREQAGKGIISAGSSVGQGFGNLFKYGRVIYDWMDRHSLRSLNPFRHFTASAMFFGRGAEAIKETRLEYEEKKYKQRINNEEDALVEASKIHKIALEKAKGKTLTAEDFGRAYKENLPNEIQNRLNRMDFANTKYAKKILEIDAQKEINKLIEKVENIQNDDKLSNEKKGIKIKKYLHRKEDLINDLDRMISDQGVVDKASYISRIVEKTGKGVANILVADSIYRLARTANNVFHILDKFGEDSEKFYKIHEKPAFYHGAIPEDKIRTDRFGEPNGIYPRSDLHTEDSSISSGNVKDFNKGVVKLPSKFDIDPESFSEDAIINKGEGIEHALIRQLKENPEDFGFKGDIENSADLNKWAGGEAHRLAIKSGYVDKATGQEIRVGAEGIDKAAYVLEKDADGKASIHEYFKDSEGNFKSIEEHEFGKSKFEGADKEAYEYAHKKPDIEVKHDTAFKAGKMEEIGSEAHETEYLSGEIEDEDKLNELAEASLNEKIERFIGLDSWDTVKELSARDVLDGKYGVAEGTNPEIYNLAQDAKRTLGPPDENQTIGEYLLGNEKAGIQLEKEVGDIPGLVKYIEGVPEEFQDKMHEIFDKNLDFNLEKAKLEKLIKESTANRFSNRFTRIYNNNLGTKLSQPEQDKIMEAAEAVRDNNDERGEGMDSLIKKIREIKNGVKGKGVIEEIPE